MPVIRALLAGCILLSAYSAIAQSIASLPELPAPTRIFQDSKQFNAVTLGPGNTFTVRETPPDLRLVSFDISPDGAWVAMLWASGRVELLDTKTGSRIAQYKP